MEDAKAASVFIIIIQFNYCKSGSSCGIFKNDLLPKERPVRLQ